MNKATYLCALALLAIGAASSANAITWDFSNYGAGDLLANTKTFTAGGQSISAYGYTTALAQVDLWYKNDSSGETGLGLANHPYHEIMAGNFISLMMPTSFARTYDVTLDSLQCPLAASPRRRPTSTSAAAQRAAANSWRRSPDRPWRRT